MLLFHKQRGFPGRSKRLYSVLNCPRPLAIVSFWKKKEYWVQRQNHNFYNDHVSCEETENVFGNMYDCIKAWLMKTTTTKNLTTGKTANLSSVSHCSRFQLQNSAKAFLAEAKDIEWALFKVHWLANKYSMFTDPLSVLHMIKTESFYLKQPPAAHQFQHSQHHSVFSSTACQCSRKRTRWQFIKVISRIESFEH